jgi:hypothetical protein
MNENLDEAIECARHNMRMRGVAYRLRRAAMWIALPALAVLAIGAGVIK